MKPPRKSKLPSAETLFTPFALTCTECGGQAVAYPYPLPEGTCYCPCTSPAWLKSFVEFATANLREERGLPREFEVRGMAS